MKTSRSDPNFVHSIKLYASHNLNNYNTPFIQHNLNIKPPSTWTTCSNKTKWFNCVHELQKQESKKKLLFLLETFCEYSNRPRLPKLQVLCFFFLILGILFFCTALEQVSFCDFFIIWAFVHCLRTQCNEAEKIPCI